jgi:hypothetical protein
MACYGPRVTTIAVAGAVVYVLLHRVIGRILHIAGLVLEVALIVCLAAAAAALLAWTIRSVQRRRAAAGACSTCRFRCQQPVTLHPQPVTLRARLQVPAARASHQPGALPRPDARPRPEAWPGTPARPRPETRTRPEPWPGTPVRTRRETKPLVQR